jgi:PDZ domain protein
MAKTYPGIILRVLQGSIAEELELVPGDKILSVNNMPLRDIIDFSFAMADEEIEILVEHADGEQELIEFDKDYDEDFGVEFEHAVFDGIRECANHCYFCFVDMIAPDMRHSLSVKDDDYRLSFLYGNFVTLTNMGPADFSRIERFHLSPLYVSVQCTNPVLRAEMLRYKGAADILGQLAKLEQAGAEYHTQVVLCYGLNDGAELERTIRDITARRPYALSLAIVPVGLTKHRSDPFPLVQFDREGAARVIDEVERWQKEIRAEEGRTFIYLGDEFYFLAGREVPPAEMYDGFPQLDNGIGLTRNFIEEWSSMDPPSGKVNQPAKLAVISGTAVAPVMEQLAREIDPDGVRIRVLAVENIHFGATVNVSGLLTGYDIMQALRGISDQVEGVLIPSAALREGEDVFLDDVSLDDMRASFPGLRIEPVATGRDYREALSDWTHYHRERISGGYTWQSNAGYTKPAAGQR